ncbi:hypothetical protein KIKIMORA_00030 [Brevundimonas phage vB_BpoS-Kikimora]|uniref:Uncharacterized protein n=1 Tax=Brevundimonas phage vB_BpoS-Kikimora TaxID=2948601 RepID=A0A9E7MRE1_9CAUD|nr:hypothetical protein KIKIMORA_00030 [Brevundimonas phage vB_BpoS-Kikimora]
MIPVDVLIPIVLMVLIAVVFLATAIRTRRAPPAQYARARRLSGTARDVVVGSVGTNDLDAEGVTRGMAMREVDGRIIIARTGRLTDETLRSL